MYKFKVEAKEEVLKGRTITYVSKNILEISQVYLSNILNGTKGCSIRLARDVVRCISPDAKIEDYFIKTK